METVVVMFVGPHYNGSVHFGRIGHAIMKAKELNAPLIICGDANRGDDVGLFSELASNCEVACVIGKYDPMANTLGDAQLAADELLMNEEFRRVRVVHLVTDWYHMGRARAMLEGEIRSLINDRMVKVIPEKIWDHYKIGFGQLWREIIGTFDYKRSRYGKRIIGKPLGKPTEQSSQI